MERQAVTPQPKRRSPSRKKAMSKHIDELLDEALEETFPASDAISIDMRQPRDRRPQVATAPRRTRRQPAK
jgi:hypothetical protein